MASGWRADLPALTTKGVSERLAKGLTVITYNMVCVTDHYCPGNPYLVFTHNGHSCTVFTFKLLRRILQRKLFSYRIVELLSSAGTLPRSGLLTRYMKLPASQPTPGLFQGS